LYKTIRNRTEKAILDYEMIRPGDRVLVGVSGGVDSFALLRYLKDGFIHATNAFSFMALHVDLGFKESGEELSQNLEQMFQKMDVEYRIVHTKISQKAFAVDARKSPCFICSQYRRKTVYETAHENRCNKIAYGHHKDDIIETLLINILFGRKIEAMRPVQEIFKGKMHIVRPFFYVEEALLKKLAIEYRFPQFPRVCPADGMTRRQKVKSIIEKLQSEEKNANIRENIFKSLFHANVDLALRKDN
jgi:tRNA 2-thiocytidine biosynthesis protein TtcA